MNTRIARTASLATAVALVVFGSSSAMAQQDAASPTRADVQAEVVRARANGELGQIYGYQFTAPAIVSSQSRADVKAGVTQARAEHTLDNPGERYGFVVPVQNTATVIARSRADVKAELLAAIQRGERLDGSETY